MLRLRDSTGVTHGATWTYGEWVGRTWCGYEFVMSKNQGQRRMLKGRLIASQFCMARRSR